MTDLDWIRKAACRKHDPELFYARTLVEIEEAKSICATCPVKKQCAEYSKGESWGIWAGEDKQEEYAARIAERQARYRQEAKERAEVRAEKNRQRKRDNHRRRMAAVAAYEAGDRSEETMLWYERALKTRERHHENEKARRKRILANARRYEAGERGKQIEADYQAHQRKLARGRRITAEWRERNAS